MAGPVIQGIDTLASAMKGNIIPDQEYLLQGSLLDSHIETFKHRFSMTQLLSHTFAHFTGSSYMPKANT